MSRLQGFSCNHQRPKFRQPRALLLIIVLACLMLASLYIMLSGQSVQECSDAWGKGDIMLCRQPLLRYLKAHTGMVFLEATHFCLPILTECILGCAEVQRNSGQASSGLTSSLSSSRAKPTKQDVKDRESRDQAVDLMFDRKRVPLEALVRRSSPIAVAAKEEEPAEPQVRHCCSRFELKDASLVHAFPFPPLLLHRCSSLPPPPPPALTGLFKLKTSPASSASRSR